MVNSQARTLDAPPIIREGRTMLPVRFISENLGCQVDWNAATQEVLVTK
jgi:N-acetylmuramoyl-L-alanine amidase